MNQELESPFDSKQWENVPLAQDKKDLGFCSVYVSFYAVVGIVTSANTRHVIDHWADCQAAMIEFNKNLKGDSPKDSYLIFVIPEMDTNDAKDLEKILNDTYVCRKMCLEQAGRSIAETLRDSGLVAFYEVKSDANDVLNQIIGNDFPSELINDLIKRSPDTIIQKLMGGQYTKKQNEN